MDRKSTKEKYSGVTIATIAALIFLVVVIFYLVFSNNTEEYTPPTDSSYQKEQLKTDSINRALDSIVEAKRILEQRKIDSFNKTPIGKAKIAAQKIEDAKLAKAHARIQKVMDKFNCSEWEAEEVLEHKIWIGMQIMMVVYERGNPNAVNPSNYGYGVHYQYCWEDYSPSCFYSGEDGIVTAYN